MAGHAAPTSPAESDLGAGESGELMRTGRRVGGLIGLLAVGMAGCGYRKLGHGDGSVEHGADLAATVDLAPGSDVATKGDLAPGADRGPSTDVATADTRPDAATLTIDSLAHDFGTVVAATPSADAVFVVRNSGTSTAGTLGVTLTGASSGFSVKSDHCGGMSLAGGASCEVVVIVTPANAGAPSADLTVSANPGGSVAAHLTATAIAAGALKIDPGMQDFGMVVQNRGSASQTFTISNTGRQASGAASVVLGGTDKAEFQVTADGCSAQSLVANGSCQITVRFGPTTLGARSASLTVSASPGGAAVAQLAGTGITQGTVAITPDSHAFGSIQQMTPGTSQVFTVKNAGQATTGLLTATISGTDGGDFTISANSCNGFTLVTAATCAVTVQFTPFTSGSKLASLAVAGVSGETGVAQLSGRSLANPAITITPTTKSFNAVTVNQNASATFSIANPGGVATGIPVVTLAGVAAADSGQFSIAAGSNGCIAALPAMGSCTITVRFAPTTIDVKNATLTVSASPGTSATATLTGTGIAPGKLSMSPLNQDFGSLLQGTKSPTPVTFVLSNSGASPTGTLQASIAGTTEFQIMTDNCSQKVLAPLSMCTVSVVFAPNSASPSGSLQIVATGPADSTSAGLTGIGLLPAKLVITPTSAPFVDTLVSQPSSQVSFTIRNTGGVATGALASSITGTNLADFSVVTGMSTCAAALASGAACTLVLVFTPKTAGNSKTASLNVSATPGGSAAAALTGNGITAAALSLAPAAMAAFGNVVVGMPRDQMFVVSNTGQQASSGLLIGFNNTAGPGFSVLTGAAGDCAANVVVSGSSSCNLRVRFAPAGRGMQTASLSVSAATGGSPAALALSGTGQLPAGLSANPASVNLSSVQMGVSVPTSVTITNGGDVATGLPTLTNSNAAELIVVTNGCAAAIGPAANCTIALVFKPAALGARSGSITVTASGSSVVFTVSANGTVPCGGAAQACCGGAGGTCTAAGTVCGTGATCGAPVGNGVTCQTSPQCISGNCTGGTCCAAGQSGCSGSCVDLTRDNANCGTCAKVCVAGKETCTASLCRGNDAQPCTTAAQCVSASCTLCYPDRDGDGFGDKWAAATGVCGLSCPATFVADHRDCLDDPNVFPMANAVNPNGTFHLAFSPFPFAMYTPDPRDTSPDPWDYDCDDVRTLQIKGSGGCETGTTCTSGCTLGVGTVYDGTTCGQQVDDHICEDLCSTSGVCNTPFGNRPQGCK